MTKIKVHPEKQEKEISNPKYKIGDQVLWQKKNTVHLSKITGAILLTEESDVGEEEDLTIEPNKWYYDVDSSRIKESQIVANISD